MSDALQRLLSDLADLRARIERLRHGSSLLVRSAELEEAERRYRDLLHITSRRLVDEVGFERCATILASAMEGGAT